MFVPVILACLVLALGPVAKGDKSLDKDALEAALKNNQGVQYERLDKD